jgi:hypothetical protein
LPGEATRYSQKFVTLVQFSAHQGPLGKNLPEFGKTFKTSEELMRARHWHTHVVQQPTNTGTKHHYNHRTNNSAQGVLKESGNEPKQPVSHGKTPHCRVLLIKLTMNTRDHLRAKHN